MINLTKSYPLQVFRHRLYIPFLNLIDRFKDFTRKVNTQQYIELKDIGLDPNLGSRYETVSYSKLKKILKFAKENHHNTFIDIGCGLGRPLIVANEIDFKYLHGIDISEYFINRCRKNLDSQGCNADLLISDISNYEIPPGKICIYIFNPFGEKKMKEMLFKINNRKDDTLILYFNPKHSHLFDPRHLIKEFIWHNFGLYEEKCHAYLVPGKGNP